MTQPPIIPGQPYQLADVMPGPVAVPPRKRRWVAPVVAVIIALAILGGLFAAFALKDESRPAAPTKTKLRVAYQGCQSVGDISDGDRTLWLDLGGAKYNSGVLVEADLACVLGRLDTPSYVIRHMTTTRALDGRQSDSWGSFEASWTYHPDNGLDVLIRQVKD